MTPEQVDLVQRSFDMLWPVRREFAALFYRRFFELAPDAQTLFPNDLERLYMMLMDMLAAVVGALDKRELFQSMTTYAGRRHARFGARPPHFIAFGDALIWCLEQQFGESFTPELRQGWITLYEAVRGKMISAAERVT
ncbi:MAG: globin domain-containing protein [Xanthobacteraceae bacterium]